MFDRIFGLPLHPLSVHASVVLVPLLAAAALAYALLPQWRARVGWLAVLLAVVAPIATVVSVLSGDELRKIRGYPLEGDVADHSGFGENTMWATIGLGVVTLAFAAARRVGLNPWVARVLAVLMVIGAAVAGIYVFLAGDAGSRLLWEDV